MIVPSTKMGAHILQVENQQRRFAEFLYLADVFYASLNGG